MTTHPHPMSTSERQSTAVQLAPRPRWLVPALIGVPLVGALLAFGVISPMVLLYAGLIGGCALMHLFGHGGHGGHGESQGNDRAVDHAGHSASGAALSSGSSHAQPPGAGSTSRPGGRAFDDTATNETERHDQHSSHGCH